MSLEEIRETINRLDREIVRLIDERARAGQAAGELKKRLNLPLHNPTREREILDRLGDLSDGSMPLTGLRNIYRVIMAETLASEKEDAAAETPATGKRDCRAEIIDNLPVAPGFRRIRLRVPELAGVFAPGQFFQLRLDAGTGVPFLRRPFAPSDYTADGLAFVYAVVGDGTERLARLPAGTEVSVLAPLGTGYDLLPSGRALVIGGGCGGPSLCPLVDLLGRRGVETTVILGARTADALLEADRFAALAHRLVIATDDGSRGCPGTCVDAYHQEAGAAGGKPDRIYACGPLPMLRAAADLAAALGVECQVSLEERMACGFGACMGCAVPVRQLDAPDGFVYRRVCQEGPVFSADDLAWEAMEQR
ncbi:MAG: chorismate mutase [Planctomycetes bacterium]|nr:chorismate mutase [Planctomycetota bacterium]